MSLATRSAGPALAAVLGPRLRQDAAALAGAVVDGVTPRWVARPGSVDELARVLALAHEEGLAVTPRGSGSALELGRPPARLDLVLDLGGLDRIVEYNPDDLTVTAQAGVTGGVLAAQLAAHRQMLPLDPPGWPSRTLGGIVATQASGPRRMRYGAPRDLLLGVRFVQADGVSTWGGARVVKSVTGYDVPKLLAGSLGTLGVLAELTLRLHPAPEAEATTIALLPGPAHVQDFVGRLLDSTVQPDRVEYLDAAALTACAVPEAGAGVAGVAVSIATVAEAVRAQHAVVARLAGEVGGRAVEAPAGFWSDYERVELASGPIVLRVSTLVTRVAATASVLAGGAVRVTGSLALGLLRVALPAQSPTQAASFVARLRAEVAATDGSAIVERAPREVREAVDPWGPIPDGVLDLMRALKREFDPRGVLNPGRFVGGL